MSVAVQFDNVSKRYDDHCALRNATFCVPQGEVFGLIGRNGAGKTTSLRILMGLARATSGSITMFGGDTGKRIGYAPDVPTQYGWMTGREYLELSAGLAGLPKEIGEERISALLERANMTNVTTQIREYSRGMQQILGIAHALINQPDLLVLDEPTSALDPAGEHEVLDIIASLRGEMTILIATHLMRDIERIADRIAILERGEIIASGNMDEIRALAGSRNHIEIRVTHAAEKLADALLREPWVQQLQRIDTSISLSVFDESAAWLRIPALAASLGVGLEYLASNKPTLEEAFLALTEGMK